MEGCILYELEKVVHERARTRPRGSYTVELLEKGTEFIARKVGEEAVEVIVAALSEAPERLAEEVADLLYHLTVLLYARGLNWGRVFQVLEARRRGRRGGAGAEDARSGPG